MSEPFVGEIRMMAFNFAPTGWALCDGQLMAISQNQALFALIGTYYGGNGVSTFGLPDLRSRVPIHQGQGAGLSSYTIGQSAGTETTTLLAGNLPPHTHPVNVGGPQTTSQPSGGFLAQDGAYATAAASGTTAAATFIGPNSGNQPFNHLQPYLTVNFCIALEGIFPSRN